MVGVGGSRRWRLLPTCLSQGHVSAAILLLSEEQLEKRASRQHVQSEALVSSQVVRGAVLGLAFPLPISCLSVAHFCHPHRLCLEH